MSARYLSGQVTKEVDGLSVAHSTIKDPSSTTTQDSTGIRWAQRDHLLLFEHRSYGEDEAPMIEMSEAASRMSEVICTTSINYRIALDESFFDS